jgi:hypothetical protein
MSCVSGTTTSWEISKVCLKRLFKSSTSPADLLTHLQRAPHPNPLPAGEREPSAARGYGWAQKKGAHDARPLRSRARDPARGWSLDQISQPRNPENVPSTGNFTCLRSRSIGADGPRRRKRLGKTGCSDWLAEPKLRSSEARLRSLSYGRGLRIDWLAEPELHSSEGWRPGLDLNQDIERCTALALTLPPPGRERSSPIAPQ